MLSRPARSSWSNVPGIFRPDFKGLLKNEKRAVRELISVQPHEFASDETMFEKLVRMQHFGLPTRLLDVSRNALVALYFATDPGPRGDKPTDGMVTAFAIPPGLEKYYDSDSVSCLANLANMNFEEKDRDLSIDRESLDGDISNKASNIAKFNGTEVIERLLQFIKAEKPYFQAIIDPLDLLVPYYVHPKMSNKTNPGAIRCVYPLRFYSAQDRGFFPYVIEKTPFFVVPPSRKEPYSRGTR